MIHPLRLSLLRDELGVEPQSQVWWLNLYMQLSANIRTSFHTYDRCMIQFWSSLVIRKDLKIIRFMQWLHRPDPSRICCSGMRLPSAIVQQHVRLVASPPALYKLSENMLSLAITTAVFAHLTLLHVIAVKRLYRLAYISSANVHNMNLLAITFEKCRRPYSFWLFSALSRARPPSASLSQICLL